MSGKPPLLMVTQRELISSGLQPDLHNLQQGLWEAAANVSFRQGKVKRLVPPALMFNYGTAPSVGLSQHQDSSGTRWVWNASVVVGTTTDLVLHRWYGPAAEQVGAIAGATLDQSSTKPATQADFLHWGNWTLINPSFGAIQRYTPGDATPLAALPNAPTDVVTIMKRANQLFAIGHGLTKKDVSWSHADAITNWTIDSTTIAGRLPIEEFDTGIRGAAKLGPNIAVYAEDQMALVYWTGAPYYYGQRVQLDGIGLVGKKAVCADGPLNYGVSRNGIWQTDGQGFRYIDEGILNGYLQSDVNWDQASKIVVTRNDVTRCIDFHFPVRGSLVVNEGWSFDPSTGGWSPITAYDQAMERKLFKKPLAADAGNVYLLEDDPAASGPLTLRTKPLTVQLPPEQGFPLRTGAFVDEVELFAKAAASVQFRYGSAEDIDGPWHWRAWQNITPDMTAHKLENGPTGTFHKLEFQSTALNWDLDLQGFALFGQAEGSRRDTI